MPEYLAPGVFVEEVSFRQKTIEGVSTSTTGFLGPTRFGPTRGEPALLTSFSDFERIYGGLDRLDFAGTVLDNDIAHAVRAYFEEGGKRLYVARVFDPIGASDDGVAEWQSTSADPSAPTFAFRARYPGAAGDALVTLVFRLGEDVLGTEPRDSSDPQNGDTVPVLRGVADGDTVWAATAPQSPPQGDLYWAERYFDAQLGRHTFRLRQNDPDQDASGATALTAVSDVRVLTVSVLVRPPGRFAVEQSWEGLTFHPAHPRSLSQVFAPPPASRRTELFVPLIFETGLGNGSTIAEAMAGQPSLAGGSPPATVFGALADPGQGDEARTFRLQLAGGNDGSRPGGSSYPGDEGPASGAEAGRKSGLEAFEDLEDISIVASPGATRGRTALTDANGDGEAILRHLVSHCERMRYRVAVLDTPNGQLPGEVRQLRGRFDSTRAAFYYPWVRVLDPVTEREIYLPPSGFVSGIYARNDVDRGVHKAPANEVVRLASGFEILLNKAQQEVLNPEGVNCLRFFEGRGFRVWGARTASSDPEWKYVNVRRYFAFLERSIEKGTQWAVFEPNGDVLWSNVRRTVEDFLYNEWISQHLFGTKPEEAFFVRCDRSTMTQNDIDNGRLICLVGVAPLRPAEFVIFRIGQKTADSQ
ncbi:MAG: phage tail sheath subtilisin-like domain-containing protein [Holophagales bacterium]|nr:phage tail sheath subtilisin-like domain-containing protein [Holophagales bacterium]